MTYAIGIDLGTTNSVMSIYRRGVTETIENEGRSALPSVVSFRDDGTPLIGLAAKARLMLDPESSVASAKRFMGERGKVYRIGKRSLSPVDVSSLILKRMVENARKALGSEVWDAVITVPAYFNEAQRDDTKRAGEAAGLNVLRLVPEPTAAAVAYGLDRGKDQTIMVYDLGGGTFDVSILQVKGNKFEVKAVGGDGRLGGDDFDEVIAQWVSDRLKSQTGVDLLADSSVAARSAWQRLKETAEKAKIELSQSDRTEIIIPDLLGHPVQEELTIQQYEELIAPMLKKTVDCMRAVLKDAAMTAESIDRVILVGGSTKNRAVRESVSREIKDPYTAERVDEVVSHGAAIVAANLLLPEEDGLPIEMSDVTGHSLGVDMLDENNSIFFRPIISRQTSYPCRQGVLGYTTTSYQDQVALSVFRGEDRNPARNVRLGDLSLPISPPSPELVPIGAIFELDANGIIHFTAVQLPLDQSTNTIIEYAQRSSGVLDLSLVDPLLTSGRAMSTSVSIKA
jgi:molecular chaperone DnaK